MRQTKVQWLWCIELFKCFQIWVVCSEPEGRVLGGALFPYLCYEKIPWLEIALAVLRKQNGYRSFSHQWWYLFLEYLCWLPLSMGKFQWILEDQWQTGAFILSLLSWAPNLRSHTFAGSLSSLPGCTVDLIDLVHMRALVKRHCEWQLLVNCANPGPAGCKEGTLWNRLRNGAEGGELDTSALLGPLLPPSPLFFSARSPCSVAWAGFVPGAEGLGA